MYDVKLTMYSSLDGYFPILEVSLYDTEKDWDGLKPYPTETYLWQMKYVSFTDSAAVFDCVLKCLTDETGQTLSVHDKLDAIQQINRLLDDRADAVLAKYRQ